MEHQQAQTTQPVQAQPTTGKGLAIASLVLGIIAFLTGLIYLGAVLGILAVIFGILALKKRQGRGMAIAGIITGALGILGTIAAIIIVILAVPALQQNARDTSRKNQVGLTVSEIQNFQANNQGQLPDPQEVSKSFETASLTVSATGEPTTEAMLYRTGTSCDGTVEARAFSVTVKLESGQLYCQGS